MCTETLQVITKLLFWPLKDILKAIYVKYIVVDGDLGSNDSCFLNESQRQSDLV